MKLDDIATAIQSKAWRDLTAKARTDYAAELEPKGGFTQAQRALWAKNWLSCAQADVDAINAVLPEGTKVAPINVSGSLYLNADLLTDMEKPRSTYYAARKIIDRLPWTHIEKVANDATIHPETGTVESPVGDQLK